MIKVLSTVRPKSLVIMAACANTAQEMGITVYITSGNDKRHMEGSKHYTDEAIDVRSKNIPKSMRFAYLARVMQRLGDKYQGLLEDEDGINEHFHFEYDPK